MGKVYGIKGILLICGVFIFQHGQSDAKRVRLEDIKSLTLHAGKKTYGQRSAPVPQLLCIGGTAMNDKQYHPQVVQCRNQGSDGMQIQWDCQAELEPQVKFGKIEVNCEGYAHPGDDYVLAGSCGLEYTLDFTAKGKKQHKNKKSWFSSSPSTKRDTSWSSGFFILVVFAGIGFVIYKSCIQPNPREAGHYGDDDDDDERRHRRRPPPNAPRGDPPPYPGEDPPPYGGAPPPGFKPEYSGGARQRQQHYGGAGTRTEQLYPDLGAQQQQQQQQQDNGWGFWSGAAIGGLTGYLFGNSGNRGSYYDSGYGGGYGSGYGGGSGYGNRGSFFGGNSGSSFFSSSRSRSSSSGSSNSGGGGGGQSRTAHGYGGSRTR